LPTRDDRGLDAATSGHLGESPYYTIADTETGVVRTVPGGGHLHGGGGCGAGERIRALGVDTVLCAGAGRSALAALDQAGIAVLVCDGATVRDALDAARRGDTRRLTARDACGGHGGCHGSVEQSIGSSAS
jgi:predicted Fe-Mo cluster-binding NifX family protein